MVAPSRLEKSEQLVNVATTSPATTHEAARDRKEERAESMTCTIILIQNSILWAQLAAQYKRDRRDWQDERDGRAYICLRRACPTTLALHAPRLVIDSPSPLG